jgi:ribosomal protein S21
VAEVRRRKAESFEALLRRFTRKVQDSGRILQVKKIRYHKRKPSKTAQREGALRREYLRGRREYLIRTGLATEEDFKPKRRNNRR